MTAHWIDVSKSGTCKMRSEVVGFTALKGNHSGDNQGRYFMGMCDRVGITGKESSKVRFIHKLWDTALGYIHTKSINQ